MCINLYFLFQVLNQQFENHLNEIKDLNKKSVQGIQNWLHQY